MVLYTNYDHQKLLTALEMYDDQKDRYPWMVTSVTAFFDGLDNGVPLQHPYYEVTETPDPEDGSVLSDMCVRKENHIELGEDEVWDGGPVFWFETEWVGA
ncbi:MAG: hypothetical protein CMM29_10870 [Rhodospirillaceae bacterium]|nr:hypothetical protein [Rhodospirillaceae bacterium]|tara:strand:- start:917 stop:1216 length:300 start_codon:yes stop_codon:yes gene_type:complete